jgi:hypothetical protein
MRQGPFKPGILKNEKGARGSRGITGMNPGRDKLRKGVET